MQEGRKNLRLEVEILGESVFFNLKDRGPEIDEETVLFPRGAKISKELRDVFVEDRFHGFELNDQLSNDKHIEIEIAEQRSIIIKDRKRWLLGNLSTFATETIGQAILVNFLLLAMTQKFMKGKGTFPHLITNLENEIFLRHFLAFLRLKPLHLSHSPITKSSEPRMAGMSETMWPGSSFEVMERLQNEGLRIFKR